MQWCIHPGVKIRCLGNSGHASKFIEGTAAEKVVSYSGFVYSIVFLLRDKLTEYDIALLIWDYR